MDESRPRLFTGRQVTMMVIAVCITVVLAPGAVWAVQQFTYVSVYDATADRSATVDASNRLNVSSRPVAPGTPLVQWSNTSPGGARTIRTTTSKTSITSLTLSNTSSAPVDVTIARRSTGSWARYADVVVPANDVVQLTFPSPLVFTGTPSNPAKLESMANGTVDIMAVGFTE